MARCVAIHTQENYKRTVPIKETLNLRSNVTLMHSDFISMYVSTQLKDIIKPYARQVAVKPTGRHEIKYLNRDPFCFLALKWWVRRSAETKFTWRGKGCYKSTLLALPADSPVHDCRYAALPRRAKLSASREAKQNCIAEAVSSQRGGRLPGTPRSDPRSDRGSSPDQARDIEESCRTAAAVVERT